MSGDHASSLISAEVRHVEALLEARGLLDAGEIDTRIDEFLAGGTPANGARIVARAWVDPGFTARLLADANTAIDVPAGSPTPNSASTPRGSRTTRDRYASLLYQLGEGPSRAIG